MKHALLVSTVSRQFTLFDQENIAILKGLGYKVHCVANYSDEVENMDLLKIEKHHIDIQRSPFSIKNIKAFQQLYKIFKMHKFDIVHCHAPMGGILGRCCAFLSNTTPVFYTAHGFHFYKGAPYINNFIYKNVERLAARWTDNLITMNLEDYNAAKKFKLRLGGQVHFIPGVGIDTKMISSVNVDRLKKRKEIGVPGEAFLLLSIGELIKRKNHKQTLESLAKIVASGFTDVYLGICGKGELLSELKELCIDLGIEKYVIFLGYRNDIVQLLKASDLFVFPSYQEGLPKSLMEALASGTPVVATKIRGNVDLVTNEVNGLLVDCDDIDSTAEAILRLKEDVGLMMEMGNNNLVKAQEYDISTVNLLMRDIYRGSN